MKYKCPEEVLKNKMDKFILLEQQKDDMAQRYNRVVKEDSQTKVKNENLRQ